MELTQENAPVLEALERMKTARLVPFDVPGHKRGRGNPELTAFLGEKCLSVDVNSMKMLDNLCHPVSVIRDAERLAAEAFGAAHAFFMIGGTTSAVQAMILTAAGRGGYNSSRQFHQLRLLWHMRDPVPDGSDTHSCSR